MAGSTPVLFARSSLFLFRKFYLEHARTMQLTDDFWHHQLASSVGKNNFIVVEAVLPLPRQRVVWYSLARWLPPSTKQMNRIILPLKDRYRLSSRPWNTLPSKTTTWRNNYPKGMQDPTIMRMSKKILAPKEGTKKDQKVATPRADKSDKTPTVYLSQIWHHHTWL